MISITVNVSLLRNRDSLTEVLISLRIKKNREIVSKQHYFYYIFLLHLQVLGCVIIGYMAWVLATSVTVPRFLDGTLIFTYVVIGLGFTLFFSGLIGWVGGASESPCLVGLFLFFIIISMVAEIGGIICLNVLQLEFEDILKFGWNEVNQGTRNLIQKNVSAFLCVASFLKAK